MKGHPKLKTQPRQLFSCGFFRHCTQSVLSPTNSHSPPLPLAPSQQPQPPSPPPPAPTLPSTRQFSQPESSSSSSSSTSQSFTQWKFPLPTSPIHQSSTNPQPDPNPVPSSTRPLLPPVPFANLQELFHLAEIQLKSGWESDQLAALHLLERSLVPNPPTDPVCQPELMRGVVSNLKNRAGAKPATKILLALCLAESNRHVAVEAGAVGAIIEVVAELEGAAGERALAALELMCTVAEGAAEVRAHVLAVPVMVTVMGQMAGRGREYAISVLAVIYGSGGGTEDQVAFAAPPEEVARAVVLALQRDCTVRGRRKGTQLLKALKEYGRQDSTPSEI